MTPTLSVSNLRTHFFTKEGVAKAVDGVDFDVAPGEILGLVGESGSGKTVTGFSILGLIDPPGRIVDGSSIKTRLASMRCMGGCGVLNMRPPSDAKSPRPVSRRGLDYCDDVNMPVICPTRQDLFCKSFLQELSKSVVKADRQQLQKSPRPISRRGLIFATLNICR